ncbi:MAG: quinone oxidoreductase [Gemmatimonadaceae bacterium]|nr:quinone oxidoreductase [Gemmatimonadaceae bacterium]
MTETMRAIRVHATGGRETLRLESLPIPTPSAGEALVRIAHAGVNFIDTYFRAGVYQAPTLPFTVGQEAAGEVIALGAGSHPVEIGERVAFTGTLGSYATHQVVASSKLVPLPRDITTAQGAAAMLQGMTAHYLACATYPLAAGETCLVHAAAGGVGSLLTQIAKLRGATVIATCSSDAKAAAARAAGADQVIRYDLEDFSARARALTEGRGVHVVYDGVGRTTFDGSLAALRPRGMMVLFGGASGQVPPFDLQRLNAGGSLFVTRPTLEHYTATRDELLMRAGDVFRWISEGGLRLTIDRVVPLAEAAEAHRALEARETMGKVLLDAS